uniref:Toll-like receptor 7.1 n=1 Tax=Littorina littorea TaxID=31216 RepID=A0A7G8ZA00_LITLI|nr:toll-like receptor 7.1 [Littorina littorea]
MGPARFMPLALLVGLWSFHSKADPVLTTTQSRPDVTFGGDTAATTSVDSDNSGTKTEPCGTNITHQNVANDIMNHTEPCKNSNTPQQKSTSESTPEVSSASTELPPLTKCRYDFQAGMRNNLFFNSQQEVLPLLTKRFVIHTGQPRCYLTRDDFESKLDQTSGTEAIVIFLLGCLDAGVTQVELREDVEDSVSSHGRLGIPTSTSVPEVAQAGTHHTPPSQNGSEPANETWSGERYYHNYISYFQSSQCRLSVSVVEMIANMTDLNVLTVHGDRAWDLRELETTPRLCDAFRAVKAFSILGDWSAPSYLQHLARCTGKLGNVVEMVLSNDSLPALPDFLATSVPNLRALELRDNKLTAPVVFPWADGFAELPRNMSRTFQFNDLYNFRGSFDMPPHLFRRLLILDGNNITNLTRFQFTSDFQFISLQRNGLLEIAEDVFDLVPGVQFLSLAHNRLTSLPAKLFSKLTALRKLDLQGNLLKALPDNIFRNVRRLNKLNVERNALEVLQDGLFTNLQELTELRLKNNSIRRFDHGALSMMMVKLKLLELQHNPLTTFPVIVLELRGLVHTNLEYTDIQALDFVHISQRTSPSRLAEALKNPTTGDFTDMSKTPTSQRVISLRFSKLRSVVLYNATRETLPIFMLVIKHFTILMEGAHLACDCNILNVTHQLQDWKAEGKLTGTEECLEGWNCAWPSELSGKRVASLEDDQTYCPLEEEAGTTACPEGCACFVRTQVETVIVDCKHTGLTSVPPRVPANTRELWLQNNSIKTVQKLPYLRSLHSLRLTANNLQELPADVVIFMPQLRVLHVDDNWLTSLAPALARLRHLQSVRVAGNPIRCDCRTLWLKDWLLSHKTVAEDWDTIKCSTDESDGRFFTLVPDREFVCKSSASLGDLAAPIAVPLLFAFLLLTLAVIAFIQRRRLKVLLYIHTGMHPFDTDPPDHQTLYDVSVCCDVTACTWVLRHLIEALEEGGRYKVFFYSRDAFVGFTTSENVRHCVKNSKRLVVVLGKAWEDSELLVTATKEGLSKCQKEMVHFMTVVVHNFSAKDITNKHLQQYTQRGRYITTEDKHFTKKLLYEMPHLRARKKRNQKDPEKATIGKTGKSKKDDTPEGPEPVAFYDIVVTAENEQNNFMKQNSLAQHNKAYCHNSGHSPAFDRQLSVSDLQLNLKNSQDTSYTRRDTSYTVQDKSSANQLVPPKIIIQRQGSEHPSVISDDLFGDDADNHNARDSDAGKDIVRLVANNPVFDKQMSVESQASRQCRSVFVWYADRDLPFTLKNIVEPLEKRGHACILQDRDFPLGAAIQENIVHAAESCTRSIFVLSDHTPKNEWFTFVFHVTFDRQMQSRDHRVALVTREDIDVTKFVEEIQQVLKTSALLAEDDPWFAKRLRKFVNFDGYEIC